MTKKYITYL